MKLRAALARVAITAVHLRNESSSVRQIDSDSCADCGSPQSIRAGMSSTRPGPRGIVCAKWQQEMKPKELSSASTFVVMEIGPLPLISENEVKRTIAIHVGN